MKTAWALIAGAALAGGVAMAAWAAEPNDAGIDFCSMYAPCSAMMPAKRAADKIDAFSASVKSFWNSMGREPAKSQAEWNAWIAGMNPAERRQRADQCIANRGGPGAAGAYEVCEEGYLLPSEARAAAEKREPKIENNLTTAQAAHERLRQENNRVWAELEKNCDPANLERFACEQALSDLNDLERSASLTNDVYKRYDKLGPFTVSAQKVVEGYGFKRSSYNNKWDPDLGQGAPANITYATGAPAQPAPVKTFAESAAEDSRAAVNKMVAGCRAERARAAADNADVAAMEKGFVDDVNAGGDASAFKDSLVQLDAYIADNPDVPEALYQRCVYAQRIRQLDPGAQIAPPPGTLLDRAGDSGVSELTPVVAEVDQYIKDTPARLAMDKARADAAERQRQINQQNFAIQQQRQAEQDRINQQKANQMLGAFGKALGAAAQVYANQQTYNAPAPAYRAPAPTYRAPTQPAYGAQQSASMPSKAHNPANDATGCIKQMVDQYKNNKLMNTCSFTIELVWCKVGGDCGGLANTWTFGAGNGPSVGSGQYGYAACRGANSIANAKPSPDGRYSYSCPDSAQPRR